MGSNERAEAAVLPRHVLAWASSQAGERACVTRVTPLQGGISSAVYALEVCREAEEEPLYWVMRQFTDMEWLKEEPDVARHETAALKAAQAAGQPSPRWIAADPDGDSCGLPTVLMTRLPGRVVLPPKAPSASWITGLAAVLAGLHQAKTEPMEKNYFTYNQVDRLQVPGWTSKPSAWAKVIECVQAPPPAYVPRLIHRDYHPANVLWQEDRVSGVVDWVNACRGPAGIDTGHCRVNLVQLYGTETADAFLEAYLKSAPELAETAHPYWDMLTLIEWLPGPPGIYKGWTDLGFSGLTEELVESRLDEYAELLARKA
ncbi:aminoglycoside phosphotransferase family protein [Paenibacillus sp. M1]|uniref:Aminoglycoside phosphotransferase family protein n=1 Tax=Paenibacillus haidiansis TaxID=1574488 RepID=A0ABU7VP72_9BACL